MKKVFLSAITVLGLTLSNIALSQSYVGGNLGMGRIDVNCTSSCDKSSTGGKIYAGHKFAPNWAGEVSYIDYGKVTSGPPSQKVTSSGVGLGVAYHGVITDSWNWVARGGLASNRLKAAVPLGSSSDTSIKPYLGVGVGYAFSPELNLTAEADFSKSKLENIASPNVRLISLGLRYGF
jgi:OmpA-OmpF porin, OOP family